MSSKPNELHKDSEKSSHVMGTRGTALITGAAGFLGSHLCDRFIKEGYHVIAMDNLITGDLKNIEHLFALDQFEFIEHDVNKRI